MNSAFEQTEILWRDGEEHGRRCAQCDIIRDRQFIHKRSLAGGAQATRSENGSLLALTIDSTVKDGLNERNGILFFTLVCTAEAQAKQGVKRRGNSQTSRDQVPFFVDVQPI